jgi:hypothetical protein
MNARANTTSALSTIKAPHLVHVLNKRVEARTAVLGGRGKVGSTHYTGGGGGGGGGGGLLAE